MNADAVNLPEMLRRPDGVVFVKDVNMSGVTGPDIGPELAALVEAQDKYFRLNLPLHHEGDCACDFCTAANKVVAARAALAAKIGGKG